MYESDQPYRYKGRFGRTSEQPLVATEATATTSDIIDAAKFNGGLIPRGAAILTNAKAYRQMVESLIVQQVNS